MNFVRWAFSKQLVSKCVTGSSIRTVSTAAAGDETVADKLFKSIEIEIRSHDKAVLESYTIFLRVLTVF